MGARQSFHFVPKFDRTVADFVAAGEERFGNPQGAGTSSPCTGFLREKWVPSSFLKSHLRRA